MHAADPSTTSAAPSASRAPDRPDQVVRRAAATLSLPPVGAADSFVLHAALEVGARFDLLPYVPADRRPPVLERIQDAAATYGALDAVAPPLQGPPADRALHALCGAIAAGDIEAADAAACALPRDQVLGLADLVLPLLAAAGHGVIALDRLRRVPDDDPLGTAGLRLLARQAAEHPGWRLAWHADHVSHADGPKPPRSLEDGVAALVQALVDPPAPGPRGDGFIYPTLHQVESSGLAAEVLAGPLAAIGGSPAAVDEAGRHLLRVAARSMLQDDPDAAAYGWTHCLTLPLGALGLAGHVQRRADALAVAATYVLAFRSTQGAVRLDPTSQPPGPSPDLGDLASFAGAHPDAHLAKYTEACLRAAALDPEAALLYVAAAAHLGELWRAKG